MPFTAEWGGLASDLSRGTGCKSTGLDKEEHRRVQFFERGDLKEMELGRDKRVKISRGSRRFAKNRSVKSELRDE